MTISCDKQKIFFDAHKFNNKIVVDKFVIEIPGKLGYKFEKLAS